MSLEANDLMLFARVAEEGSFSRAAERVGLPKSTVSRRLAALEAQLGERLLLRTTRKLTVTDFGHSVLEHANQVLAEVEAAASLAQHRQVEPSGRLRISMPADFANVVLGEMLNEFLVRYPAITLELDLSPRRVDLIGENFDVAIRMGDLPDDASLAARRIAAMQVGLYASPAYLARRGEPSEPEALMEHDTLQLLTRSGEPAMWTLQRGEAQWQGTPSPRATANSPEMLIRMARAGAGITVVSSHFAVHHVRSGELVPVLPGWSLPDVTAWAVFPGRRLMPARTRVLLDAMATQFSGPACERAQESIEREHLAAKRLRDAGLPGQPAAAA
ncbi:MULTISPECIES: LysR family transcriptional regulator [unclassified Rhizobacter]|uniref:LysR family transcriptional regulator n=1 Tax=unclassified Rhizobacter TaxID=2640088 RepID=UPI0006F6F863|nr:MULTISPECIES: LysR family transcriptional regulator [unclassified Rhizobacter]KQU77845.1 LysR family transcriptional regulator [Rhizobacter sp. Root29]KQW10268.1 LysR family transcriptional regulator [Rhizobacter sp. Root1238]KRB20258.1 LysR family transcriptional regulator [Rhizobacter sp. Root16D2]